jgi:hypothetical protein
MKKLKPNYTLKPFAVLALLLMLILNACKHPDNKDIALATYQIDPKTGEINYHENAIHPLQREKVFPGNGADVSFSPPTFIWPAVYEEDIQFRNIAGAIYPTRSHDIKYSFKLADNPKFEGQVYHSEDKPWAFYNHHKKLKAGNWYWQYAWSIKGAPYQWSDVYAFQIKENAYQYETLTAEELFQTIPETHPRILTNSELLVDIQKRKLIKQEAVPGIMRVAKKGLAMSVPKESDALPPSEVLNNKSLTKSGLAKAKKEAVKNLAKNMSNYIQNMVLAYLISGEIKYGEAAVKWGMRTASFKPHGLASSTHFADARHMRNMAWVFDNCYGLLSENQKEKLLEAIQVRAHEYHTEWVNGLENITNSGHVWQQLHFYQIQTAIAILHHIPEAKEWLEYAYGVFIAKAPALSSPLDGAWANGTNYMSANQFSILNTSLILKSITGHDYLNNPWFENNAWYVAHAVPFGSSMPGFGDSFERYKGNPSEGTIAYMDFLARAAEIKPALWYSTKAHRSLSQKKREDTYGFQGPPTLAWFDAFFNQRELPSIKSAIPQAHAFKEVGIVAMHSNVNDASNSNTLFFKSSPFGQVSNHAHAANNAFNVVIDGKMLFSPIGIRGLTKYGTSDTHNTVLINGQGQVKGSTGYGWIPRYVHGDKLTYTVGDASNAYSGKNDLLRRMNDPELPDEIKLGLQRFRRHIVMIRPSVFVIYDDLVADQKVEWSWQLHSTYPMQSKDGLVSVQSKEGVSASARVFSSTPLSSTVSKYSPELTEDFKINLAKKYGEIGAQYSFVAKNNKKVDKLRIVTIISEGEAEELQSRLKIIENGLLQIDGWTIKAEIDPTKPADLLITNADETIGLSTGYSKLNLNGKLYKRANEGSTLLIEGLNVQEVVDELPEAAR